MLLITVISIYFLRIRIRRSAILTDESRVRITYGRPYPDPYLAIFVAIEKNMFSNSGRYENINTINMELFVEIP